MKTIENKQRISISINHVWAGTGRLVGGRIEDCAAQLGADQDETEVVYEAIEEAIESGEDSLAIKIGGEDCIVTWSIT